MMPSFKNTASIFPEISFTQYFPLFSCKQYDVITDLISITDLICIIEKCLKRKMIFQKEKNDISKGKTPFFILKGLSNKHRKNFISQAL